MAPRALAPVLQPFLHLPHFPSPLTSPYTLLTPQGSQFHFAVESLRGLIPSSITLHPCSGTPLVYFLSPGCPRHLLPSCLCPFLGIFSPNHFCPELPLAHHYAVFPVPTLTFLLATLSLVLIPSLP